MKLPTFPPIETHVPKEVLEPHVLMYLIEYSMGQLITVDRAKALLKMMEEEDRANMLQGAKNLALAKALRDQEVRLNANE